MIMRPLRYQTFFADLKRRGVFAAAAVYGGVAFVVIQAADFMVPALNLSDRVSTTIALVAIMGFPLTMVFAWFFDLTLGGMIRTDPAEEGELEAIVSQPLVRRWPAGIAALLGITFLTAGAWWTAGREDLLLGGGSPGRGALGSSLAVLPCEHIGPGSEDPYLAEGMHEEILLNLQKISSLTTIGRSSVLQYRERRPPLGELADLLQVRYLGECTVRREEDRIRFTFMLSEGSSGQQVWAENYDRNLTAAGLFDIQSDVARRVAVALESELTTEEQGLIQDSPTENLEAYEFYLRGSSRFNWGYVERDIRYSIQMFEEAVRLDPTFAVAYARLSRAHGDMVWFSHDRSEERYRASQDALEAARDLAPGHPETFIAEGFLEYHLFLNYQAALDAFRRAEDLRPNDPLVRSGMAYVQRRQGNFTEAAENLQQALRLDPLNGRYAQGLATTYLNLRRYDEAQPYFDEALRLLPQWPRPWAHASRLELARYGDPARARAVIEQGIRAGAIPTDDGLMLFAWLMADMFDGRYQEAIDRMERQAWPTVQSQFFLLPVPLLKGYLRHLQGSGAEARSDFDEARGILEEALTESPGDDRLHSALGIAYAGLGRVEEAIQEGVRGVTLMPPESEANKGVYRMEDLAQIYAMVGEDEKALEVVGDLLGLPGTYSVRMLEVDPRFAHLREHPVFQDLLGAYGANGKSGSDRQGPGSEIR
jgi:serine/threonine-protein kinase